MWLECTSESWITVDITNCSRETIPQNRKCRVHARRTAAALDIEDLRWLTLSFSLSLSLSLQSPSEEFTFSEGEHPLSAVITTGFVFLEKMRHKMNVVLRGKMSYAPVDTLHPMRVLVD